MDIRERNRYEMFIRIDQYGKVYAVDFPAGSAGSINFLVIAEVIANLREYAATQTSGAAKNATTRKSVLRDAILVKMRKIARTARGLSLDKSELSNLFRVSDNDNDTRMVAAARDFAANAQRFKADFISYKMPADFIENLTADVNAFEKLLGEKAQATGDKIAATASIDDEIERGMNAARRLDAIIQNVYEDEPGKLAEWLAARHVKKSPTAVQPDEALDSNK